jgi:hypothetical protein
MVSRRTRVVSWIFRRDHPSRPNAMICCFFSFFKTFAMFREATYPPAAVNVLDVSSESMAAFQVFMYGRFWVFTEEIDLSQATDTFAAQIKAEANVPRKLRRIAARSCKWDIPRSFVGYNIDPTIQALGNARKWILRSESGGSDFYIVKYPDKWGRLRPTQSC